MVRHDAGLQLPAAPHAHLHGGVAAIERCMRRLVQPHGAAPNADGLHHVPLLHDAPAAAPLSALELPATTGASTSRRLLLPASCSATAPLLSLPRITSRGLLYRAAAGGGRAARDTVSGWVPLGTGMSVAPPRGNTKRCGGFGFEPIASPPVARGRGYQPPASGGRRMDDRKFCKTRIFAKCSLIFFK
jgi:hypothetical protein